MKNEIRAELKGSILEKADCNDLIGQVPEGYFDKLPNEVLQKIETMDTSVKLNSSPRIFWMGMAASVVVLLGFVLCLFSSDNKSIELLEGGEYNDYIEYVANDTELSDIAFDEFTEETLFSDFEDLEDDVLDQYIEENTEITELVEILDFL